MPASPPAAPAIVSPVIVERAAIACVPGVTSCLNRQPHFTLG
jgi:hypothetical protein